MRVLLDLQGAQTESRFRGIGRQARSLATAMLENGSRHDFRLLLNGAMSDSAEALTDEFSRFLPRSQIYVLPAPSDVSERAGDPWRTRAAELLREVAVARLAPEVVHVSSIFEGVADDALTSLASYTSAVRTAVTLHDLIPFYDERQYLADPAIKSFYYRRAQAIKRADLLLAVSESAKREAAEVLQVPPSRIDVILEAVEPTFRPSRLTAAQRRALRSKYKLPDRFVLYVGAIEPRKNVEMIIRAFRLVPDALQRTHSVVFGGIIHERERNELLAAAARAGLPAERLVFTGFIADEDLPPIYGLCDLFVFPSLHEGFGLPPLEAMACGAPTIAARNTSLPEVMGRDDVMFDTFDAADLARLMARVLGDARFADELRRYGVARAGSFSWAETGRRAISALERLEDGTSEPRRRAPRVQRRSRLAFVSQLPGDRSGIANYSSELLRELGCYYDVECIVRDTVVTDPWILANFPVRDVAFFESNYARYDRVLYAFGNSEFHTHMLSLLPTYPGAVILHDFFLSGVLDWMGNVKKLPKENFLAQLYLSHGLPGLDYVVTHDRHAAADHFPANSTVFDHADGVLVHSHWSKDRAAALYGPDVLAKIEVVPLLKPVRPLNGRERARRRLDIADDALVVCSFGFVADTKLSDILFAAWEASQAGRRRNAILVFVGDNIGGEWGATLTRAIERAAPAVQARITGYVDDDTYKDFLAAADIAVQLRQKSRGETSGAILDCLAAGLPVIVNAHGPTAELPSEVVVRLPDRVTIDEVRTALDSLAADESARRSLSERGRAYILENNHPHSIGRVVRDAIERFATSGDSALKRELLRSIGDLEAPYSDTDIAVMGEAISRTFPPARLRSIYYDVTLLAETDSRTGIERVTRALLAELVARPPDGYRLEPVRIDGPDLRHARRFTHDALGLAAHVLPDSRVQAQAGDIYVTVEWAPDRVPALLPFLKEFRRLGGKVVFGIHDLLPLRIPDRFPDYLAGVAGRWFDATLEVADQYLCVSRSVADDVVRLGGARKRTSRPIGVDHFRNAADIGATLPSTGRPAEADALIGTISDAPTFLMVGTVEPRKGHAQVLSAFEEAWRRGRAINLLVVGRQGWSMEGFAERVARSPHRDKRLFWRQGLSDEFLLELYRASTALIAASEAEGFGLPIVEAALHGLPVIARDIPVFREVAGDHAFYFSGSEPADLADALDTWTALHREGRAPSSSGIGTLTWREATRHFVDRLLSNTHEQEI